MVPVMAALALVGYGGCDSRLTGCPDPVPILQSGGDAPSGFVQCADGLVHRQTVETCLEPHVPGDCDEDFGGADCATDSDCSDSPHGACVKRTNGCFCEYGCATDADCGPQMCVCAGSRARCVPGSCSASSDCGDGLCALESGRDVCGAPVMQLACLNEGASCRTEADCAEEEDSVSCPEGDPAQVCRITAGGWSCGEAPHCGGPCG